MNILVTVAILLSRFAGLNCLTCKSCSSFFTNNCLDPYDADASNSSTCSSDGDTCFKSVANADSGVTILSRGCATDATCTETCTSTLTVEVCEYCCTTDDCNGAGAVTFSLATVAASFMGVFVSHI